MSQVSVLLIEDEPGLALTLSDLLGAEGYRLKVAVDGEQGLAWVSSNPDPELVLLDVNLPGIDGFEVCRILRQRGLRAPILMLTARGEVRDRVMGLRLGADDYLLKPFDPLELLARMEALLRRSSASASSSVTHFGDLQLDLRGMSLSRAGKAIDLTSMEFQLLAYLIENTGTVLSRETILREVWGFKRPPQTRTVDVHITWLRNKIEPDRSHPRHIVTMRGAGYKFVT